MLKGLFPGTFDPPTKGHLQLIRRAAALCDQLVVGIGENTSKGKPLLTVEERIEVLEKETKGLDHVKIASFPGLTVDFAKTLGVQVLIRGLRSEADLEFEKQMASANRLMGYETLFLIADPSVTQISSSLIRELAAGGAPLHEYIPEELESKLHTRLYSN